MSDDIMVIGLLFKSVEARHPDAISSARATMRRPLCPFLFVSDKHVASEFLVCLIGGLLVFLPKTFWSGLNKASLP